MGNLQHDRQINIYYIKNSFKDFIGKIQIVYEQVADTKEMWKAVSPHKY